MILFEGYYLYKVNDKTTYPFIEPELIFNFRVCKCSFHHKTVYLLQSMTCSIGTVIIRCIFLAYKYISQCMVVGFLHH